MQEAVDCVVIGAGVIGLAIARYIAQQGRNVLVLEAEDKMGQHASSRHSDVMHAGLYYPENSLKARYCVRGKLLLSDYLQERQIAHQRIGKYVVATTEAAIPALKALVKQARNNGVDDIQWMSKAACQQALPDLTIAAALWSPSSGVFDCHGYLLALLRDLQHHHGALAVDTQVVSGQIGSQSIILDLMTPNGALSLTCRRVVIAAGLGATALAKKIRGIPDSEIPRQYYCKGNYFRLLGKHPFRQLVYPLPGDVGLGIHATVDASGQVRFGPDVEWVNVIDYTVDESRKTAFAQTIGAYWPGICEENLVADYAGIRASLSNPDNPGFQDFMIRRHAIRSQAAIVGLYGIESPGLTASLAIAEAVGDLLSI